MAMYVIAPTSNNQWRFTLHADNGEKVLTSETYVTKQGANAGIQSVRVNAPYDQRYDRKTSTNGYPYFVLKATNGEILGTSELYSSTSAREAGIAVVKRIAPTAKVVETATGSR